MPSIVRSIDARGLFERFDIQMKFRPDLNVIYGQNGTGKTTLLHILANALSGDFARFSYLQFEFIDIELDDCNIHIERDTDTIAIDMDDGGRQEILISDVRFQDKKMNEEEMSATQRTNFGPLPTAYFPAFRTMIEAWESIGRQTHLYRGPDLDLRQSRYVDRSLSMTQFARELFGPFVPKLNFPSPFEIERRLSTELEVALLELSQTDRQLLNKAFTEVFAALSDSSEDDAGDEKSVDRILEEIRALFDQLKEFPRMDTHISDGVTKLQPSAEVFGALYEQVQSFKVTQRNRQPVVPILKVYRRILKARIDAQEKVFKKIENYLDSVNEFLTVSDFHTNKRIGFSLSVRDRSRRPVEIQFLDNTSIRGLNALSSGERQIVTLIYAATHMSKEKVILIDEPEISLHVDWQRMLFQKMRHQLKDQQIIACTHSLIIGADYDETEIELTPIPSISLDGRHMKASLEV